MVMTSWWVSFPFKSQKRGVFLLRPVSVMRIPQRNYRVPNDFLGASYGADVE